jgi:hypothetical protein
LPPLSGWRHAVFGADAIAFCQGTLALTWNGQALTFAPIERATPSPFASHAPRRPGPQPTPANQQEAG